MKFELRLPDITSEDKIIMEMICMYYGYELIIDDTKKRYMIVGEEDMAYIQKHDNLGLFIIWRKNEYIQYVTDIMAVTSVLDGYQVIPDQPHQFNRSFIQGLQRMLKWIPGVTLTRETEKLHGK